MRALTFIHDNVNPEPPMQLGWFGVSTLSLQRGAPTSHLTWSSLHHIYYSQILSKVICNPWISNAAVRLIRWIIRVMAIITTGSQLSKTVDLMFSLQQRRWSVKLIIITLRKDRQTGFCVLRSYISEPCQKHFLHIVFVEEKHIVTMNPLWIQLMVIKLASVLVSPKED